MEFIWKLIISLTLSTSLLTGTTPAAKVPPSPSRLVVQADIREQKDGLALQRHYTSPDKIEAVLYFYRGLRPQGPVQEDPERYAGTDYRVTLHFSDGACQTYRQRADRWLSVDSSPWQRIDPKKASLFGVLLRILPGDP